MCADNADGQTASVPSRPLSGQWRKARSYFAAAMVILVLFGIGFHWLQKQRQMARAASCPNDVFYLVKALAQYASDHDGVVPPISNIRGNIMVEPDGLYPEYLDNSCWVQCEYSPTRQGIDSQHKNDDLGVPGFNDDSFCYLPWRIQNEKEGLAFVEAYKSLDLSQRDEDLVVEIDGKPVVLPRTRISKDAAHRDPNRETSWVPIIVEWPNHAHIRATVYYTNGWRRLMDIGDEFPMTENFIAGLREIASIDKPIPEWKP